jgi:light-regulated signal transduction histidine kinase (bacteriophytochrome)
MARRSDREILEEANRQLERQARALAEANASLEQEVTLRAQVEIDLLRSNRELEEFAYVAAHDLTAPLRQVFTFLDLLTRDCSTALDDQAQDYIAMASRSARHMKVLIDDLLQLARVDAEKQPATSVDLNLVLDQVLASLEPTIRETQATVTREALPTVKGIEGQMVQVFHNLIESGLKYRAERPPQIHISATHRDGRWVFCVRDNGIGIDPKCTEDVFKIFCRLHSGDEYPGTGIGLALCRRIIERHRGKIWVENTKPRTGSTFCFSLPNSPRTNRVVA